MNKINTEEDDEVITMDETMERPDVMSGRTYKISPTGMDYAFYITINNIKINGVFRPYEIFINSKQIESFEWVTIFTRLVSAVWRNGGNYDFLTKEMLSVFAPAGGYFVKGHGYMPSLVAHLGTIIDYHIQSLGN